MTAPLKPLNVSPATPTARRPSFMTAAVRRCFSKTWRGFGILSLARRLEVIADDLEMCRNQALALRIEDYWGTTRCEEASSWELPVPVIFSYFSSVFSTPTEPLPIPHSTLFIILLIVLVTCSGRKSCPLGAGPWGRAWMSSGKLERTLTGSSKTHGLRRLSRDPARPRSKSPGHLAAGTMIDSL
jgi:hypothetical protein